MITDYEVEGCWTSFDLPDRKTKCRYCGAELIICPKENHFNSKYWELQRNDGLLLAVCPNDCSVKDANKKMYLYLLVQNFCKDNSESYNYEYDWDKINSGWIDEKGNFYPCNYADHAMFLIGYEENIGKIKYNHYNSPSSWIKVNKDSMYKESECKVNKRQKDTIINYFKYKNIPINDYAKCLLDC
jgi:hypothetical protein